MKSIFTNRNIRIYTKINTLEAYIWSILLHRCECWRLTKDLERRLEAAEMWYIRRIMRISWTEKKTKEVMEMAGYKRSLLKTIRKRQLQFFWHINRADGLEKQILSGKICGTKSRGRQRKKYTDILNNFVTRKESPNNELIRRTDARGGGGGGGGLEGHDRRYLQQTWHMMMMMMMMILNLSLRFFCSYILCLLLKFQAITTKKNQRNI